jgi:hypothetical protein
VLAGQQMLGDPYRGQSPLEYLEASDKEQEELRKDNYQYMHDMAVKRQQERKDVLAYIFAREQGK